MRGFLALRNRGVALQFCLWMVAVLLSGLLIVEAEAAIGVRGTAAAYYQSATTSYTVGPSPALVGVGAAVTAASGNVTPALPAGIAVSDMLLCVVESHDNVAPTFPAGWTRLYRNRPGTEYSTAWYKIATAVETNPTITHTAGGSVIAQCLAYRNVLQVAPTVSGVAGTGANVTSGSGISTTVANELLLMATHLDQGATTTAGWNMSTPGGLAWTQQFASTTTLGTGTPVAGSSIGLFSATKAVAGAQAAVTTTIAGTVNAASLNYGTLIEMKPGLVISKPAGTVSGDLMVLAIAARSSGATITPPAGWTLLLTNTETTATTNKLSTYYKIAGASEPASYSWSTGTTESVASLVSFSGVDAVTPFDGVTPLGLANTAATTTQTAPSITPASANDWLVTVHELTSTPCPLNRINGWAPPAGMAEQTDSCSRTPGGTTGMGIEMNTLALTTAGAATGTRIATAAANAARGISQSMVLRPAAAATPDHIEIDYPAPPFSTCAPTSVTVYACTSANPGCSPYYTGGVSVTLSPGGNVVNIPSGSGSGSGTVFQTSAGAAALDAVSAPAALMATSCKNISSGAFGCGVTFSAASLAIAVPNLVSGNSVAGTVSGCTAQLPVGANSINFYTAYQNPASGTKQVTINATPVATSGPGTAISLNFDGASPSSSASFSLSYPDVGGVALSAVKGSANGSASFVATPHHFTFSNITCVSGCSVISNPGAANASGAAFIKAGNRFSITVTANNSAGATTPNFGAETPAESVDLTPTANMADLPGAVTGALTGSFGSFSNGVASGNAFSYDEVGIVVLAPSLHDPDAKGYLSIGNQLLNPVGTASGNVGRFIPDHFDLVTDPDSPIVSRSDFLPQTTTTVNAAAGAGATTIGVAATAGFNVGDKVRIPGAAAGGNAFAATITAVGVSTLTLSTATGAALAINDIVINEWGTYMGERMDAQFTLNAVEFGGSVTNNYQGVYAKLNPAGAGNPLGFGAVDAAAPIYNLALDTSLAATGSFSNGGATITAPLAVVRGATAIAPYASLRIGVAPSDSDGIKMGTYDLGVTSATADHTSIMDPLVQANTETRFGRIKLSNAVGSEKSALQIPVQAQYWSGNAWVLNANDSLTQIPATSVVLSNYRDKSGTPPTPNWTTTPASLGTLSGGQGTITLSAPAPAGGTGSVDLAINLGTATVDASCLASHPVMTAPAMSLAYLRGTNGSCAAASTYAADPSATATFGVYVPETRKAVHIRELF